MSVEDPAHEAKLDDLERRARKRASVADEACAPSRVDTSGHILADLIAFLRTQLAARPAAAAGPTVSCGKAGCSRVAVTTNFEDVGDVTVLIPLCDVHRGLSALARPAAESVAVPPEVCVVESYSGDYRVVFCGAAHAVAWTPSKTDADLWAERLRRALKAHWPRAVSSEEVERLRAEKDGAYNERDRCVALIARMALALGLRAGLGEHDPNDASWDPAWRTIVFIDLPAGQVSWHIADHERALFAFLSKYAGAWDGHTTPEKYARVADPKLVDALTAARAQGAAEEREATLFVLDEVDAFYRRSLETRSDHGLTDADERQQTHAACGALQEVLVRLRARAAAAGAEGQASGATPAEQKGQDDEQGISGAHAERGGQGEGGGDCGGVRRAPDDAGDALPAIARDVDHPHEAGGGVVLREEGDGQRAGQQRVASLPPCAACGGSGTYTKEWVDPASGCFMQRRGDPCPKCTGHAPPPASVKEAAVVVRLDARPDPALAAKTIEETRRVLASSATAGEDDVEGRRRVTWSASGVSALLYLDGYPLGTWARSAVEALTPKLEEAVRNLVRSERRRAVENHVCPKCGG